MAFRQIDCFRVHLTFLKIFAVWPGDNPSRYYVYYSRIYLFIFFVIFLTLYTINFYFLPRQLEVFAEEMLFYINDLTVLGKVLTFIFMRDKIRKVLHMLESETFHANSSEESEIIRKAKQNALMYWKITAGISVVANIANVFAPFFMHLIFSTELEFPVCRYSFIPKRFEAIFLYPTYWYQSIGITTHMWYDVNCDTFLLGIIILGLAQLEILDRKLRKITDICKSGKIDRELNDRRIDDRNAVFEINKCIKHYDAICKYCKLIQEAYSKTLFLQFSLGSCKICVCLFRFTLFTTTQYFVFLTMYMIVMILQIMVPCWFGSKIIEKSSNIAFAVYDCDWTPRCRRFKSNLRLLVERANKPLSITGGKIFLLSLETFTTIINSAYSFFTLLRHMQSR